MKIMKLSIIVRARSWDYILCFILCILFYFLKFYINGHTEIIWHSPRKIGHQLPSVTVPRILVTGSDMPFRKVCLNNIFCTMYMSGIIVVSYFEICYIGYNRLLGIRKLSITVVCEMILMQ